MEITSQGRAQQGDSPYCHSALRNDFFALYRGIAGLRVSPRGSAARTIATQSYAPLRNVYLIPCVAHGRSAPRIARLLAVERCNAAQVSATILFPQGKLACCCAPQSEVLPRRAMHRDSTRRLNSLRPRLAIPRYASHCMASRVLAALLNAECRTATFHRR